MHRSLVASAIGLVLVVAGPSSAEDPAAARPFATLPYTPSLEPSFLDRGVDPCVDLYAFSCGGWMRQNPIPSDQARWSVYGKLYDENQQYLWGILEAAAADDAGRDATTRKIGDYFAACMDAPAIEKAGASPLAADLAAIEALATKDAIAGLVGGLHLRLDTAGMLFGFGAEQDFKDSGSVIAAVYAGGIGLPDRDYYVKDDDRSKEIREKYALHVARMLELVGDDPAAARTRAGRILEIETTLAKATLTRVEQRDPYAVYHRTSAGDLAKRTPAFRWKDYFASAGIAPPQRLNLTQPEFFRALDAALGTYALSDWKDYLRWHLVRARAPYLSESFVRADFDFYRATLRGVREMPPRWKRCVTLVDRDLGEALGKVFVEKTFPPAVKASVVEMVGRIDAAMERRIAALDWMGPKTKKQALGKLRAMRDKIGYPDRFRDYGALAVSRGDFHGNVVAAIRFESLRQLGKIGKPVDRDEWGMTPPTVNAYYNPSMNDMNFPAGVLLPPLYDPKLDDAPNYGNTGATIGHELIHGFDDEGRRFDAKGNLRDWWTESDGKTFEARAACIAEQYAGYTIVDDIKINSRLTLGEDVADLGGTILAWEAWKAATAGKTLESKDGLTPEQRFFVGFAQWTCENETDASKRVNALTNPHSPGVYRINGVVANMPEFAKAFQCNAGAPLVPEKVCRIW